MKNSIFMKVNLPKIVGITLILFSNLFFISVVLVFFFETFEIGSKLDGELSSTSERFPLHSTNYYGQNLEQNPYSIYDIKYLHPYYFFSLPHLKNYIELTNNKFASIDDDGFRNNPYANNFDDKIILLGGSTAFSFYSSSDKTSISAYMSKLSGYSVVNRNSPGWNSLQELIALLKYNQNYTHSISLSFYNDLATFCDGYRHLKLNDSQSRFFYWNNVIENEKNLSISNISLKNKIKYLLIKNFPQTKEIYKLTIKFFNKSSKSENNKNTTLKSENNYCGKDYQGAVKMFLKNQKIIRQISEFRGAKHILLIQPIFPLHKKSLEGYGITKSKNQLEFQRQAIDFLLKQEFCNKDCYDFSNVFDDLDKVELVNSIKNGEYKDQIFADNTHLTDRGNKLLAEKIFELESFK